MLKIISLISLLIVISLISFLSINNQKKERFTEDGPFSGWTDAQYKALFYDYKNCNQTTNLGNINFSNFRKINPAELNKPIPTKYLDIFDWADGSMYDIRNKKDEFENNYIGKNIMGTVKNQKFCGCCYAFSTIGVIESAYYLSLFGFGVLKEFSTQQIIDCTSSDQTLGCNQEKPSRGCGGGTMIDVIGAYFSTQRTVVIDNYYPYRSSYETNLKPPGTDGSKPLQNYDYNTGDTTCKSNLKKLNTYFLEYIIIGPLTTIIIDDEKYLKEVIYKYGPVYVTYYGSSSKYFKQYRNGFTSKYVTSRFVYNGSPVINALESHAMIVTGWGIDRTTGIDQPYWLVKNSWGSLWGIGGYMRMAMVPNVFKKMYAIEFDRPKCDVIYAVINLTTLSYNKKNFEKEYVVRILFNAFRLNRDNKIKCFIKSYNTTTTQIIPTNNPVNSDRDELIDVSDAIVQNNNKFYYNKVGDKFVQSNTTDGLWFQGATTIPGKGNKEPPITDNSVYWSISLQIVNIKNEILYKDQLDIYWKDLVIIYL